ncbi:hypothetical protein DYB32_001040 [Aphanomyces invadans]|uniref:RRM domain-containing protein n=1 Tax=Aphanomyces invadans TaxID=157072 RepID=A0A3R7D6D1_9STRA|nr:hypothetical protein DYB32_001040 [Aphanomyces invadans]
MRVTVVCDKATGQPKGYAYIEFATPDAAQSALALNETPFRGRQIKVTTKRVNERGFNGAGRGRGDRSEHPSGRGGGRRGGCNVGSPRGPSGRGGGRGGGRSPPPSRGGRGISHDGDLSLSADAAGSGSTGNPPLGPGGRVVYL